MSYRFAGERSRTIFAVGFALGGPRLFAVGAPALVVGLFGLLMGVDGWIPGFDEALAACSG